MIASILLAAAFLSTSMAFLHVPQEVAAGIAKLNLSPYQMIATLAVFYILLGLFLEGISITVMSLPITLPLVLAAGFDPIWFGIFMVLCVCSAIDRVVTLVWVMVLLLGLSLVLRVLLVFALCIDGGGTARLIASVTVFCMVLASVLCIPLFVVLCIRLVVAVVLF